MSTCSVGKSRVQQVTNKQRNSSCSKTENAARTEEEAQARPDGAFDYIMIQQYILADLVLLLSGMLLRITFA